MWPPLCPGVQAIGCGVRDHAAAIAKLQADRKALTKQVKLLQQETAQSLGQSLADRAATQVTPHTAVCTAILHLF